jgi:hypothetical protein
MEKIRFAKKQRMFALEKKAVDEVIRIHPIIPGRLLENGEVS